MQHSERWSVRNGAVFDQIVTTRRLQSLKRQVPQDVVRHNHQIVPALQLGLRGLDYQVIEFGCRISIIQIVISQSPPKLFDARRNLVALERDRVRLQTRVVSRVLRYDEQIEPIGSHDIFEESALVIGQQLAGLFQPPGFGFSALSLQLRMGRVKRRLKIFALQSRFLESSVEVAKTR